MGYYEMKAKEREAMLPVVGASWLLLSIILVICGILKAIF